MAWPPTREIWTFKKVGSAVRRFVDETLVARNQAIGKMVR